MSSLLRALAARPRSTLAERLQAVRRDAVTVVDDFLGRSPAPFSRRNPLARHLADPPRRPADQLAHRALVIERIEPEARDTLSFHLVDPSGRALEFAPGQFFTVLVTLPGGVTAKRAYSLSDVPGKGENAARARITVKRMAQGKVSSHLHENVRASDTLTVLGPSGCFGISTEDAAGKHLLLIGGGSGITPLRSIVEARLSDPTVTATVLYGNREEQDIVFRRELDALARAHAGRLAIRYVLEAPPPGWAGGVGRLDRATAPLEIQAILSSDLALGRTTFVLSCGPTPMMEAVREVLGGFGIPAERVREEQFSSPEQRRSAVPTSVQPVSFRVRGRRQDTVAGAGQTLLDAGLSAGVEMPFSCTMGGCGACKVKLLSGNVVAEEPNCLSAEEANQGFVLTCVSRATCAVMLEVP